MTSWGNSLQQMRGRALPKWGGHAVGDGRFWARAPGDRVQPAWMSMTMARPSPGLVIRAFRSRVEFNKE